MKTSKAKFNRFKKAFNWWAEKLSLKGYHVYFFHDKLDGSYASLKVDECSKGVNATYALEMSKVDRDHDDGPESHAKHEAIHLLLHRIGYLGQQRWTASDEIHDEAEKLVTILEKVL